jgi:tetratricopeptide (TPR) repeat protein
MCQNDQPTTVASADSIPVAPTAPALTSPRADLPTATAPLPDNPMASADQPALSHPANAQPAIAQPAGTQPGMSQEEQGDVLLARGSYAAAIRAYENASPRTAANWNKTGMAYHHLFAPEKALQQYKMAVHLDPQYAAAYNNIGAVYHGLGEYARAEKAYKTAIRYAPKLAVSYCNLGTTYFAESKTKKGEEAYQQALELDPNVFNPKLMNKIEEGSVRQQRVATAYNLARAYAAAGRNPEAMTALNQAVSAGFRDRKHLLQDKEFATLRDTPEFQQMLLSKNLQ